MTINPIVVQTGGESWIELIDSPPFGFPAIKTFSLPPDEAAGVTSIGNFAFTSCTSLASITLPAGVTSIGNFAFSNCASLKTMDVLSETPPTLSSDSLSGLPGTCSIRVPAGSVDAYKAATYWSARAASITALP